MRNCSIAGYGVPGAVDCQYRMSGRSDGLTVVDALNMKRIDINSRNSGPFAGLSDILLFDCAAIRIKASQV